ncbi:MAG: hypothetical protein LQ343_000084 [Gyalolechia ehrenbergii]|nr:MAG: hypothetical protein LQ343_000084 [Gyalolechia ehrenbergii]
MKRPRLFANGILILPINAFGAGHQWSGADEDGLALVHHHFAGSWKANHADGLTHADGPTQEEKKAQEGKEEEEKEKKQNEEAKKKQRDERQRKEREDNKLSITGINIVKTGKTFLKRRSKRKEGKREDEDRKTTIGKGEESKGSETQSIEDGTTQAIGNEERVSIREKEQSKGP